MASSSPADVAEPSLTGRDESDTHGWVAYRLCKEGDGLLVVSCSLARRTRAAQAKQVDCIDLLLGRWVLLQDDSSTATFHGDAWWHMVSYVSR